MDSLLPYEFEIIEQALAEDSLTILARGLCLEKVFAHLLKAFCVNSNLVIVVNATKEDIVCFKDYLRNEAVLPCSLTTETTNSVTERVKIYKSGGVLFVTSRILILDFLTNRIPSDYLNALFIYRAERLLLTHQEAFIARLYRQKNATGRICAFSEIPTAFMSAHGRADRVMRMCNLKRLNIWPRFRSSISSCFDACAPEVLENQTKLTPLMLKIQGNILELIKACCSELKRENPSMGQDEFSVENVLSYDFERQIRSMLDPVSFSVSRKSKQLLTDLKTLRNILINLLQRDCVSFYHFVNEIRKNEEVFASNTGWLFMKEADSLFLNAKQRIFGDENDSTRPMKLEENPKWQALKEIMKEVDSENDKLSESEKFRGRVFVGVRDYKTGELLRQYLYNGRKFMEDKWTNAQSEASSNCEDDDKQSEVGKLDVAATVDKRPSKRLVASGNQKLISDFIERESNEVMNIEILQMLSEEALVQRDEEPITVFHSYKSSHDLIRNLFKLCPRYVILYDPQVDFVRQIEVYAASVKTPVKVYFMVYKDSVEEQSFLISLQKEKIAFDKLMQEKSSMAAVDTSVTKRGKSSNDDPYDSSITRKGGGALVAEATDECPRVIVDMREFRSDLPPMLHQRGIDIEPVTLEVGDYLLSDDLCVERKSLSDLIGSLNSGRLYTQATAMSRLYKKPILLIEFDPSKPFNMSEKGKISQDVSSNDIQTRLVLLTVHFPALKVIWSEGAQQTANVFADLKHNRPQPDINKLPGIESAETSIFDVSFDQNFNFASRDLINKLPGLTSKSETLIFENFENFQHLADSTEAEIKEKTTRTDVASNIFEFMNHSHKSALLASKSKNDHRKPNHKFRPTKK